MMKKQTNKILLIVFFVLVAIFALTRVFRSPARESNLDTDLFGIDTAQIAFVKFQRSGQPEITIKKTDSAWIVNEGEKVAAVETYAMENLMSTLSKLKPERIVSRNNKKWDTYQVSDTTSIHMTAYDSDEEEVINWHVGKESQGITYLRPEDDAEVYAMEGSLRNSLDKNFNAWRDKTFLRVSSASVNKITFSYPVDSGFVLMKNNNRWAIGNQQADSAKVQQYLHKLRARNLSQFAENSSITSNPDITITIENMDGSPAVIKAWKNAEDQWTVTSSFQKNVYFTDAEVGKDLFVGKKALLKPSE